MTNLEKYGLFLMLLGVTSLREGGWLGGLGTLLLLGGFMMFLWDTKDAPNTGMQSDGVPPQEPGDLTPPDVHEKMWRLRNSRRR